MTSSPLTPVPVLFSTAVQEIPMSASISAVPRVAYIGSCNSLAMIRASSANQYLSATGPRDNSTPLRGNFIPVASSESEEHTSELQSLTNLVCRLLLEKKKKLM